MTLIIVLSATYMCIASLLFFVSEQASAKAYAQERHIALEARVASILVSIWVAAFWPITLTAVWFVVWAYEQKRK